jgi:hypothetical protein
LFTRSRAPINLFCHRHGLHCAAPGGVPNGGSARAYEVLRPITLREDRFADLQIPIADSGE